MFCETNPCSCGKPKKSAPTRKPITSTKPVHTTPVPTSDVPYPTNATPAEIADASWVERSAHPDVPTVDPVPTSSVFDEVTPKKGNILSGRSPKPIKDPVMTRAVLALCERFTPDGDFIRKHRDQLDIPNHTIDALIWKSDRADENNRRGVNPKPFSEARILKILGPGE